MLFDNLVMSVQVDMPILERKSSLVKASLAGHGGTTVDGAGILASGHRSCGPAAGVISLNK
jgi:hypothetical protein